MAGVRVRGWLRDYIPRLAKRYGIRLYHMSNNGNHIHLVLMAASREGLTTFLRVLGGVIPRRVLGAEKGRAKKLKFWDSRPYSRILSWGREFKNVLLYVQRNTLESFGKLSFKTRDSKLSIREKCFIESTFKLSKVLRRDWFEMQATLF